MQWNTRLFNVEMHVFHIHHVRTETIPSFYLLPNFAILLKMGAFMNLSDAMYFLMAGRAYNEKQGNITWRHDERDGVSNCSTVYSDADQRKIKAPRHWPLCGEFTGDRWIPHTKGQLHGKCFPLMTSSWVTLMMRLHNVKPLCNIIINHQNSNNTRARYGVSFVCQKISLIMPMYRNKPNCN